LNTEVQKLLSDEVTGKGKYNNLGKMTETDCTNSETCEMSDNTNENPILLSSRLTIEPDALATIDISSECKDKISKESLTSLTSLTSISDSISISKEDSSESNTLSITIKAEIEQQIKNNCLLNDSSLKLNDPSSSWSPIPRNVIHLPKTKNKSKDWEPHVIIESFELAPRFEGQTHDMWDILEVKLKVQNLDYHKKVFIRYTTNDWKSYKEEEAKYSCCIREGSQGQNNYNNYGEQKKVGLDRFIARIDASEFFVLPDCGKHTCMQRPTTMLLVARYEVLGTTYWDNNHFTDYKLELVRIPAGYDVPRHHGHSKAGDASIISCAACAEEKREAELANAKKLLKEDEKEKKERTKVRHFGGGKALLSNNFSVMNSTIEDFKVDPNNIYAQEVIKNNEMKKEELPSKVTNDQEKMNEPTTSSAQPLEKENSDTISSNSTINSNANVNANVNANANVNVNVNVNADNNSTSNMNNYQNYQDMSNLYSSDTYECNYSSDMSESSSLYSSTYSDVYTYGEGISVYDPSYYTSNYSYNPNPYSTYDYGKNSDSPYSYGRSRSFSTGSIYPSDYYERKNYFSTSTNQPDYTANNEDKAKNTFATTQNDNNNSINKNVEEASSNNNENITNSRMDYNQFTSSNPLFMENQGNIVTDDDKSNSINQPYGFTNDFNPTYQFNSSYSFGTEENLENNSNTETTSQPYNSKYNLYNYSSLYADSSMGNMYDGYDNMNSSMLNDTNAFF